MSGLRERCNVRLRVETSLHPLSYSNDYYTRHRNNEHIHRPIQLPSTPYFYPIPPPATNLLQELHCLLPSLYVALSPKTGRIPITITSADGFPFTHIIRVLPDPTNGTQGTNFVGKWLASEDTVRGVRFLDLYVGEPYTEDENHDLPGVEPYLVLTTEQMIMARDFLALALPSMQQSQSTGSYGRRSGRRAYSARSLQALASPPAHIAARAPSNARVLVTAPWGFGLEMDIMAIVVCYLVYASGEPPWQIWSYVRAELGVPELWREALQEGDTMGDIHVAATTYI